MIGHDAEGCYEAARGPRAVHVCGCGAASGELTIMCVIYTLTARGPRGATDLTRKVETRTYVEPLVSLVQCATFTGIAPGEQSRGGPKTIKFGINTKNTGINRYGRNGRIRGQHAEKCDGRRFPSGQHRSTSALGPLNGSEPHLLRICRHNGMTTCPTESPIFWLGARTPSA